MAAGGSPPSPAPQVQSEGPGHLQAPAAPWLDPQQDPHLAPHLDPQPAPQRKRRRHEADGGSVGQGDPWGQRLPPEILTHILRAAAEAEGAVPVLCRAARVCRLWNQVARDPQLWRRVSLGGTCGPETPRRAPHRPALVGTIRWLAENRFSLLQEFELSGWKSHVGDILQALAGCCPLLSSLSLHHCQVDPSALVGFLAATPQLCRLRLSCPPRPGTLLPTLASGVCPGLQLLELEGAPGGSGPPVPLPIERLQEAWPGLQVLRLLHVAVTPRQCRVPPGGAPLGFPQLLELALTPSGPGVADGVDDRVLRRLLGVSGCLRRLDLRGCARITPRGLLQLPCADLEQLLLGLPGGSEQLPRLAEGSACLAWRWRHSLRELDLAGRPFEPPDLARALAAFGPFSPLHALDLAATRVTAEALSVLLAVPGLAFLNLSACRRLPRGTKRPHRGCDQVRNCLRLLAQHGPGHLQPLISHQEGTSDEEPQMSPQEHPSEELLKRDPAEGGGS